MTIQCKIGNLFEMLPEDKYPIVIPHIVNSVGGWGSGFVIPLGHKWPITKQLYNRWAINDYDYERDIPFRPGESQVICVQSPNPIFVVNMVGQVGLIGPENPHPIRYSALSRCLERVKSLCLSLRHELGKIVEIHAPAFGTERAGGDPSIIKQLIEETIGASDDIQVTIYALKEPHPFAS